MGCKGMHLSLGALLAELKYATPLSVPLLYTDGVRNLKIVIMTWRLNIINRIQCLSKQTLRCSVL